MRWQAFGWQALVVAALATAAHGQSIVNWQGGATNNNWTTASNWSTGAMPNGAFDEAGSIANGNTAVINSDLWAVSFPDGPPGGLTVTNNSKLDIVGSGAFATDNSGPTVEGAVSFTNGGALALTGGSTSFASQSLSFAGGGVYAPVIAGANHGLISVTGGLNLAGGTLRPTFSFSPAGPQSWVLADVASITGTFTVDGSASGLAPGRKLFTSGVNGGVNGQQLRLDLKNVLVASLNADTGSLSLTSPTGAAIAITGYGISSASGQLRPANWTTVTSQVGGGWSVAGTPTANSLDELGGPVPPGNTTQASLTVGATSRAIGSPFNTNLPFGVAPDVKFEYVTPGGELVQSDVVLTGLNAFNTLLLTVDPGTGQARLTNSSKTPIKLRGYSILSNAGSLKPTGGGNWNSLQDQGTTGVEEANASTTNLSELVAAVASSVSMAAGQSFLLGSLFNTASARDLQLEFVYTAPLPGDFNGDGSVNAADLTLLKGSFGTTYSGTDFLVWQRNVGKTSSAATPQIAAGVVRYQSPIAEPAVGAVPEPSASTLFVAAIAASMVARETHVLCIDAVLSFHMDSRQPRNLSLHFKLPNQ